MISIAIWVGTETKASGRVAAPETQFWKGIKAMNAITPAAKTLFTGKTHSKSGRDGYAKSADGLVDLKLSQPHPAAENLFAAAWSACYMGAIELAAAQRKIK